MDSREVKSILSIYRPGIDDDDPQFAEALAEAERDPELRAWLFEQGKSYDEIREKLRGIIVPGDLREKSQSCFLSRQYALASGRLLRR